jgi:hypothetical protein
LVDAARAGLVESMVQLAVADRGDLHHSALTLRSTLDAALARRSVLFVLGYLAGGIERLLWAANDYRTAALLGRFARLHTTSWTAPSVVDVDTIGRDALGSIDAEAARLDLDSACAIARAALDRIVADD